MDKIFQEWSLNSEDTADIAALWLIVEANLPEDSEDIFAKDIHDFILDYTSAVEKHAFMEGYKKAVQLMTEIFFDTLL